MCMCVCITYYYMCTCTCIYTNNYTYYTIRRHYKHLCKLLLRIVIRRSSLLACKLYTSTSFIST